MNKNDYKHATVEEIALIMNFTDDYDTETAADMAAEMLSGVTRFNKKELHKIALYKGVSVEDLTELDPSFALYKNPVSEARKDIAKKLVVKGFSAEFAADITGIRLEKVLSLQLNT